MGRIVMFTALTAILALGLLVAPLAEAQESGKKARIGVLLLVPRNGLGGTYIQALRQGLGDLGYVEGQNLLLEIRSAEGKPDRLAGLAAEILATRPDVLVTSGSEAILTLKRATSTVPIVMATVIDPVALGIAASLARPEGNLSGLAIMSLELTSKRLQLLKEAVPRLSRVACSGIEPTRATCSSSKRSEPPLRSLGSAGMTPRARARRAARRVRGDRRREGERHFGHRGLDAGELPLPHRRVRGSRSPTRDLCVPAIRRCRRLDVLWAERSRFVPALCGVCRQDPERRQARKSPHRATDHVRAGDQPQDREDARADDPADAIEAGGSGHRMICARQLTSQ